MRACSICLSQEGKASCPFLPEQRLHLFSLLRAGKSSGVEVIPASARVRSRGSRVGRGGPGPVSLTGAWLGAPRKENSGPPPFRESEVLQGGSGVWSHIVMGWWLGSGPGRRFHLELAKI